MSINAEEIKASHNIVDVVAQFVDIKKQGTDYFGCCPFHGEKTPSFSVSEKDQFYHCFGCGANGDVIKFIMEYQCLDFVEASKALGHDAALNPGKSASNKVMAVERVVRLPLGQQHYTKDQIARFIGMCDKLEHASNGQAIYLYQGSQAVVLTDTNKSPVTVALLKRGYKPRFMGGKFLFGSCSVAGEIAGAIHLFTDWYEFAQSDHTNKICVFSGQNLPFIYKEIKNKVDSIVVHTHCDDAMYHCESLCVELER